MTHRLPDTPAKPKLALDLYRWRSGFYDLQLAPYEPIRRHAISRLQLKAGQTVLDVGCGTGMSLPLLRDGVAEQGRVISVDQCPEMLHIASRRVAREGWKNVELVCAPITELQLNQPADAVLLHFTHDILQTPEAVDRVLSLLKPGGRLVATGLQWTHPMLAPMNALVWWNALQSTTTLSGLEAPWALLAQRGLKLERESFLMGTIYVASATVGDTRTGWPH